MSLSTAIGALLLLVVAAVAPPPTPPTVTPSEPPVKVWENAEYKIVPVRVHLLRDATTPAAGTKLTDEDVARIFRKANGIWHAAGVHLLVESVISEPPASVAGYEHQPVLPIEALLALRTTATRPGAMFHVYYMGEMPPNGIFMRRDGIFVKETARLRRVPGGIDEPLPRVSAHELGHGMGLPHRQDTTNLMASGTTGTSLNAAEIEIVRQTLSKIAWIETPETCRKTADTLLAAGHKEEAFARYRALLALPGEAAAKAEIRAKMERSATPGVGAAGNGA
jgi:hypothetical protein